MITAGKVVSLSYILKNAEGEELDRADADDPFSYLHGANQIVSGLQSALDGLNIGDKKNVTVPPNEGYGDLNDELRMSVQRSSFPKGAKIEPGMQFVADVEDGHQVVFTVEGVAGDTINVNGNHPLAGETLHFAIEVLGVRDATKDELAHGHAHGPDGHHHH